MAKPDKPEPDPKEEAVEALLRHICCGMNWVDCHAQASALIRDYYGSGPKKK